MHLIGDWIKAQWVILLVLLLTLIGFVLWLVKFTITNKLILFLYNLSTTFVSFKSSCRRKDKAGQKGQQKENKGPTKASPSKTPQPTKSEGRKFGKLFRKKKSNVDLLAKTKTKQSETADALAKKRSQSHFAYLDKPITRQSMVASLYNRPKQELPAAGVIHKPPGEKELPVADAVNKPKPEKETAIVNATTEQVRERKASVAEQKKKA